MKEQYEELYIEKDTEEEALRRLIDIVKVLRIECPWDKVQTHESLTTCMVEEAYEVVDAIKEDDSANLREELGDVLLQVVFHGVLAENDGTFSITDVINEECEKMIRRHPHIFLEDNVKSIDKVLEKWENVKSREHNDGMVVDRLQRVPKALPALMRSLKVQSKASQVGFDWNNTEDVFEKIDEELLELKTAFNGGDKESIKEELGDLLFSVVNVSRHLELNPEESLNESTAKFIKRFENLEKMSMEEGLELESMSLEEMDKLWNKAKKI